MSEHSFEGLCVPHYKDLVAYAMRLLNGRRNDALDLVQEAYTKAKNKWSTWKPGPTEEPSRSARGWLHRIVHNVFLDNVRSRACHERASAEAILVSTYGTESDHYEMVLTDGVGDEVYTALDSLEPNLKAVILLADFQGQKYKAIAVALGIPMGTVMSRLHTARKRLASLLADYAAHQYGIGRLAEGTGTHRAAPEDGLDGADEAALAFESSQEPEAEADGIHGVMARDDGRDLV